MPTPHFSQHSQPELPRYKVVETSAVHDQEIESILNHWVSQGWTFDSIQFILQVSSKRPVMAFLFFTQWEIHDNTGLMANPLPTS